MKALRRVGLFLCLLGSSAAAGNLMAQTVSTPHPSPAGHTQPAAKAKPVDRQKQEKAAAEKKKPAAKVERNKAHKPAKAAPEPLPKAKLDLSLPTDMVKELKPASQDSVPTPKPLLPYLFGEKPPEDSPFQLNGRLLSNEMQLQLRNDFRQDVEGAAIDFEFKQ